MELLKVYINEIFALPRLWCHINTASPSFFLSELYWRQGASGKMWIGTNYLRSMMFLFCALLNTSIRKFTDIAFAEFGSSRFLEKWKHNTSYYLVCLNW
jgi:hypothetical protein